MVRRRWTVRDLRRDNRSVLLSSLFFGQPCSRQELSGATGLSPASVSNVVRELIGEGMVSEAGSVDSDGGRPRVLLQINADFGYVVGVDVGETRVRVELFDLAMVERAKADYRLDPREHGVGLDVGETRVRVELFDLWCMGRRMAGRRFRWGGCCGRGRGCRCMWITGRRRWGRRSCGLARGGGRGMRWCA